MTESDLVKIALSHLPIKTPDDMWRNGQRIYNAVAEMAGVYSQPQRIIYAIERETGFDLLQEKQIRYLLDPYNLFRKLAGYIDGKPLDKQPDWAFWLFLKLRARAIIYWQSHLDRYVEAIVKDSLPGRCFGCNCKLHNGYSVLYPEKANKKPDSIPIEQLELRYFCKKKCEKGEKRWLKEAKLQMQKTRKALKERQ